MSENNSNRIHADLKTLARLFSKIKVSTTNFYKGVPCWEWQAYTRRGYGEAGYKGKKHAAYSLVYQIFVEIMHKGLELDHLCRNRLCVNPAHLEAVTHAVNMSRGAHALKTHCKRGHELSGNNLIPDKLGRRMCQPCRKIRDSEKKVAIKRNRNKEKTYCKHGHRFTVENTYIRKNQSRQCRACTNQRNKTVYAKLSSDSPEREKIRMNNRKSQQKRRAANKLIK